MRKLCLALAVLVTLNSCAITTAVETPKTARESLVALEYTYQAAMGTLQHLMMVGVINPGNSKEIAQALQKASSSMEVARVAVKSNTDDALNKVQFANNLVTNLIVLIDKERQGG